MSYKPKDYPHLFPLGFFDSPDIITKWEDSHNLFAKNQTPNKIKSKQLLDGLTLNWGHIKLGDESFANYMYAVIDTNKRQIKLNVRDEPAYPIDHFSSLNGAKFVGTMGYFYLTTNPEYDEAKAPPILTSNMAIVGGKVIQPPVDRRSTLYIDKSGKPKAKVFEPKGTISIGNHIINWVTGKISRRGENHDGILFTSTCLEVVPSIHEVIGKFRTGKKALIAPDTNYPTMLCINGSTGKFVVEAITKDEVYLNDKHMVIGLNKKYTPSDFKIGDEVIFENIDGEKIEDIDSAVSIGPTLYADKERRMKQVDEENFNPDPFLANKPHSEEERLTRGAIIMLKDGQVAHLIVDGIPQASVDRYPGTTIGEFAKFIDSEFGNNYITAIATDPGSTSKQVFKNCTSINVFGNTHYLAYEMENGEVNFWPNGEKGRKTLSYFEVY